MTGCVHLKNATFFLKNLIFGQQMHFYHLDINMEGFMDFIPTYKCGVTFPKFNPLMHNVPKWSDTL